MATVNLPGMHTLSVTEEENSKARNNPEKNPE